MLHVIVPGIVARLGFAVQWKRAWLMMLAAMIVDLDHLFANPVYDPGRCGIGFHSLHSYPAIAAYVVLAMIPKTRFIGLGLVIHMVLDGMDCVWMVLGK